MTLSSIGPQEAKRRIDDGAIVVDIREPDEHAREHIPGARQLSLSRLAQSDLGAQRGQVVIFHCRSGARTRSNAAGLAATAGRSCEAFLLEGGLEAWRRAGLPTVVDPRRPIELMRQVQIAAGSLAFIGTLLGWTLSPWLLILPLFVGAGLLHAGITGSCGMAALLQRAPWNRAAMTAAGGPGS